MSTPIARPRLLEALPLIGPARDFLGAVLPLYTRSRAVYGDAFRIRMARLEMICLFGPAALELLETDSALRPSDSLDVLDGEMQSRLPSMFDGPHHMMFRKVHLQFTNKSLEVRRREDILRCLARHTERWQPGATLDMLPEAQTPMLDSVDQKYLRAAFREATCPDPPGPAVVRYANHDIDFGDYTIRKEAGVWS